MNFFRCPNIRKWTAKYEERIQLRATVWCGVRQWMGGGGGGWSRFQLLFQGKTRKKCNDIIDYVFLFAFFFVENREEITSRTWVPSTILVGAGWLIFCIFDFGLNESHCKTLWFNYGECWVQHGDHCREESKKTQKTDESFFFNF